MLVRLRKRESKMNKENSMDAFDKIIGYSEEKKELARIADALKNREV